MKGFPNQVADLGKLAKAMHCIEQLGGRQARDDGALGEALVRAGVAGPGHGHEPIEAYLRRQRLKRPQDQSPRATARLLRELFKILGLLDELEDSVRVTDMGHRAAGFAGLPMNEERITFWRRAIRNMCHDGGDGQESHPYQVLLRLIARTPGIAKPKCALALEAKNDSSEELDRIAALVPLSEEEIRRRLGVTESNWANAVKVLPKFAEQLGDVVRIGQRGAYRYEMADAPGHADAGVGEARTEGVAARPRGPSGPRTPRASRQVTPATIATTAAEETFDEVEVPPAIDPTAAAEAIRTRRNRQRHHNLLVQKLARRLTAEGTRLHEIPFDMLAVIHELGILVEVKTLDGTEDDERERVRDALAQLLYYEAFVTQPVVGEAVIQKVACFERRPSDPHIRWLNRHDIAVIWEQGDGFAGDALASRLLGRFLEELR